MHTGDAPADEVHLTAAHVGGIESTSVTLGAGISVLTGRNATNRTSFCRALMGALGSDAASLKADADAGHVELVIGDETYTQTFERRNGSVVTGGDPYLTDPERIDLVDRFAFLLESNLARQAVRVDADLRDVLMEPVDTEAIERELDRLRRERDQVDDRLRELESRDRDPPALERRREEIQTALDEATESLATSRAALAAAEIDPGDDDPATAALRELQELRGELEDLEFRLDAERESRAALEDQRDELAAEYSEYEPSDSRSLGELEHRLERLREERRSVDTLVTQLGSVISFNRDRLQGSSDRVTTLLAEAEAAEEGEGSVTDTLVDGEAVTCWTCGEHVDREQVEGTVDRLAAIRDEQLARRRELESTIDDLEADRKARAEEQADRERLQRDLESVDAELDDRAATVADLDAERESLEAQISAREADLETLESESSDDLLEHNREVAELEFEVRRLREELATVDADLETAESERAEEARLLERRGSLTDEIASLRTRIEDLERAAVEAFNEHMATVLDILAYDNIARVWIERVESGSSGTRSVDATFDLHVVRETADGAVFEDDVQHLSESEREVVGLVFALAGYLVHEVYEVVPFIVLDSLEAIDSARIASLVEYVADYAPYLVVALLPEDASALNGEYHRVTDI